MDMVDDKIIELYKECFVFAIQFITIPKDLQFEIDDYASRRFAHVNAPCFTSADGKMIVANRDWLKKSFPKYTDDIRFFVFHELRHVHQKHQVAKWLLKEKTEEKDSILTKWEEEFRTYQTNYGDEESQKRNFAQEIEIDANAYALSLLNLMHLGEKDWSFEYSLPQTAFSIADKRSREYYKSRPELKRYLDRKKRELTGERVYEKKPGRNDTCPCGSGIKFKKCCIGKGIYD